MKILFLGLGSIGRRHLSLLEKRPGRSDLSIFALRSGAGTGALPSGVEELKNWAEVERAGPEVAFICNPTSLHIPTAIECARRGMHLFIEKPVGHSREGLDELVSLVREKRLTAYVAYPLRFHGAVAALRDRLKAFVGKPCHVRAVVSSYLPDWRPGTDHKTSYSARRELGGGVILDLSHEFDLLQYLFGPLSEFSGTAGRIGNVSVDCEDFADVLFRAGASVVNLHMNYFSMENRRALEIDFPEASLKLDLTSGSAEDLDSMFARQLDYFFENLTNPRLMNNLEEARSLFERILNFKDRALA